MREAKTAIQEKKKKQKPVVDRVSWSSVGLASQSTAFPVAGA